MAVTVSLFNHTAKRFASGENSESDVYKIALYTAVTPNAAATTLAGITKTEVANGNGYTTGGATLSSVTVTTVTTNDAKLDAADVAWNATGSGITASYAIIYNSTDANDPPVLLIDFGESKTADAGSDFRIVWDANGIVTWTVA